MNFTQKSEIKNLLVIFLTTVVIACNPIKNDKSNRLKNENSNIENCIAPTSDSLFMIFFERFMWDQEFQVSRFRFPYIHGSKQITSPQKWEHIAFYTQNKYIPMLNSDTLRIFNKDIATTSIEMAIINFNDKSAISYNFKKIMDKWHLLSAEDLAFKHIPDIEFIEFLIKYSNDSVFQVHHTLFTFTESYIDPDKDYEVVKVSIELENWKHLNILDDENKFMVLSNIDIGSKYRNIFFRGVDNGIWVKYIFERINDNWKLIKIDDRST